MSASWAATLVRGWVGLYTRGVPSQLRAARRDEIDDDLWCQHQEAASLGRAPGSLGGEILLRLVLGMPADVGWRLAHRAGPMSSGLEGSSAMSTRVIGALAVVAGASWALSAMLAVPFGSSLWRGPYAPVVSAIGSGGGVVFAVAAFGLAWRFHEQLGARAILAGGIAGLGALVGIMGAYPVLLLLPLGSSVLMWDLGRSGVLPRWLSIVHGVGALAFLAAVVGLLIDYRGTIGTELLIALAIPYPLSWMAIGASLLRGVPQAQQPASSA
jgi:hypothetical protein